ncbi:MAG: bifunctional 2-C-methyl-D-erythritol 4-phosphate cytidylyltransferase/2-C-methyl-D-erythritol 2,4-cyclodiphosphate synthase [Sphingomonas sp.]|uniref:bifunctional 2-C-methyl-D-erythritol 4-phosphate cytidylyltransferase/2-C-methyl-D-erythritol 2,4-cyclodiphosphate synthase n=1 Tax=Sphingomonas sp. TaxID=28214 RepID=UPI00179DD23A|nr:bifunctional 2-C-methyl-D-erythritol 4-phosphate cytidylyltransferase/2-C-methyl-D-erythritol 2,4-cyclodiphosphate synthase [Sphingomonas sp.]MBA3667059.1 bifunctional 2-C-methyl-D-erythritol 4-phosphate cytidylyltransferase/2-C-methyl-D-erythritol 2,4-cyclodiphosphate synthase [Sphingomonas sp.]
MPKTGQSVTALIVAAGKGSRMGGALPKQFRKLASKSVLAHAVDALASHPHIIAVRVVIAAGWEEQARAALGSRDVGDFIVGGVERTDSVRAGLAAIDEGIVLVHDAARPFCPHGVVDRLLAALDDTDGAVPVLPVADTLAKGGRILDAIVDRTSLLRVQTPQAFQVEDLLFAYREAGGGAPTDESSVMVNAGLKIAAVAGDAMLEKVTSPADWLRAEQMLSARLVSRTGMGFDVHAFAGEGPIMLGGIAIPHECGLAGHSDADVVLHAITDALLGAGGFGDLGEHFPPSDPQWKGASSDIFLARAAALIRDAGGIIDFVDCTVIGEAPRVSSYREAMRRRVADILGLAEGQVSIKATTTEKLGFTGRREGLAAQAVATIRMEA